MDNCAPNSAKAAPNCQTDRCLIIRNTFQEIAKLFFWERARLLACTLTIFTGGVSEGSPRPEWFTDCQVKLLASSGVRMLTEELSLPS